jgi:hypothetical protein
LKGCIIAIPANLKSGLTSGLTCVIKALFV